MRTGWRPVILKRAVFEQMIQHARDGLPNEACGLLGGANGRLEVFYPARNVEQSPTRYMVDPMDQLRIMRQLDADNRDLLGIFHSHTHTQAYPSTTDVNLATNWPDPCYLIASLMDADLRGPAPALRAFRIRDGEISELPLDIEE